MFKNQDHLILACMVWGIIVGFVWGRHVGFKDGKRQGYSLGRSISRVSVSE